MFKTVKRFAAAGLMAVTGALTAALTGGAAMLAPVPALAQYAAIYPHTSRAEADIAAALAQAKKEQKRVLIDFGGNWCGDCVALDGLLKRPENASLLSTYFVMVHVNVGDDGIDHNLDIAQHYGIPLKKGVPALAVVEASGAVVYAQTNGEFEAMRKMDPKSVNDFLSRWKPGS